MRHKAINRGMMILAVSALVIGTAACGGKTPKENGTITPAGQATSAVQNTPAAQITDELQPTAPVIPDKEAPYRNDDTDPALREEADAVKKSVNKGDIRAKITLADGNIRVEGNGCKSDEDSVKIKEPGTYEISGSLANGKISVNTDNKGEVYLILNGVTVHNEKGSALSCKKTEKLTIELAEGTVNTLSDGAEYEFDEGEDEPDATLFSKCNLVFCGSGKLVVKSAFKDALKGKDSLFILGGTYEIDSVSDGIVGKDFLYVADGNFTICAGKDGLKASKKDDPIYGSMIVEKGQYDITSGDKPFSASNKMSVSGEIGLTYKKK